MAFETPGLDHDLQVSANATSIAQFAAVTVDPAGNPGDCIYPTASGLFALGICQDMGGPPAIGTPAPVNTPGQSIRVRQFGISKAVAAAAITVGQLVSVSGTSGQLGPAAAAGATNTFVTGIALTAATAAGDLFTVLLTPGLTTQVTA